MKTLLWTCVAAMVMAAGVGRAQPVADDQTPGSGTRLKEEVVVLSSLETLRVGPRGVRTGGGGGGNGGGGFGQRACGLVASHTDANFGGGSFVVQAGFVQGESFAATYTVPAGEWPIKIDLTEVIVATSSATVTTTTQWTISYYEGEPNTGTLVASYSSDDELLPHIVIPPGTNGVNLQFSIDPGDPEQIILNNPGNNKFSVVFRVDRMHSPPSNLCTQSPSTARNAFPVTDVSGLAQGGANWLFGINCGPLGCPANGGWSKFSLLPQLCRPSGDWVSRTTWSSVNCTPGVGACCLPSGQCIETTVSDCQSQGGTFQGDGTTCATAGCVQPTGACCFANGFCVQLTEVNCTGAGGTWAGANVQCGSGNSCPTGACCLPNGSCITGVTSGQCTGQGGTFRGVGSTCAGANCPQPTGACCLSNGFCLTLTQADCAGIPGSSWAGALTTCADGNGNGQADICEPDCVSDFNGDGFTDGFDYDAFVQCFEGDGCPPGKTADVTNDGFVDGFDYDEYVGHFESGC